MMADQQRFQQTSELFDQLIDQYKASFLPIIDQMDQAQMCSVEDAQAFCQQVEHAAYFTNSFFTRAVPKDYCFKNRDVEWYASKSNDVVNSICSFVRPYLFMEDVTCDNQQFKLALEELKRCGERLCNLHLASN